MKIVNVNMKPFQYPYLASLDSIIFLKSKETNLEKAIKSFNW